MIINENRGIQMRDVSESSRVDKGSITKSVNRLVEQGYVEQIPDENDRRIKRLYTTDKAAEIMNSIYEYRKQWRSSLEKDVDFDTFAKGLSTVSENSGTELSSAEESGYDSLRIGGIQKVTLLDYPGKVACTIFTAGCTFKCPFCHNKDLVYIPEDYSYLEPDEVLAYLDKRKKILDGVCITGGEPLIQEDLIPFVERIRSMGYLIKLDTNGNEPDRLKEICSKNLIDYVAMDVKNSPDKYAETVGLNPSTFSLDHIRDSIDYLKTCGIEHEFRTTVVRELHTEEDLTAIAEWLGTEEHYFLQQYSDSGNVIQPGFTAYSKEEMEKLAAEVQKILPNTELRGVKEN
jgi:anaerobic ribonucleoside-triphosphate reductase activating protein